MSIRTAIAGPALLVTAACASVGTPDYSSVVAPHPPAEPQRIASAAHPDVCHLTIHRSWLGLIPRGAKTGTGVLYGEQYVLTAAHNIFDPWYNPVERIDIRCGVTNADTRSIPDFSVSGADTAAGYRWGPFNGDEFQRDFGVIRLRQPHGRRPAYRLAASTAAEGRAVQLWGYPGGDIAKGNVLHEGSGSVKQVRNDIIVYDIVTATGNSGGPVWDRSGEELVGIHVSNSAARAVNEGFKTEVNRIIRRLDSAASRRR